MYAYDRKSIEQRLSALQQRGIRLWVDRGQLRFQAPKGTLGVEELTQLRACKAEIIELLEQSQTEEVPLQSRPVDALVPLTPAQQSWRRFIDAHQAGLTERLCYSATNIVGILDIAALERSLAALTSRHEALRTRFVAEGSTLRQQIDPDAGCQLRMVDCSGVSMPDAVHAVLRQGEDFVRTKIPLAAAPLFAVRLFTLAPDRHVLILALEHMIADATSLTILHRDLWALYDMAVRNVAPVLPQLPVQFADYVVWQQRTRQPWLRTHQEYWKEHLRGVPGLRIPYDRPLDAARAAPCRTVRVHFGSLLTSDLRERARCAGTLLPWIFLTIYAFVLARWCRQNEFVLMFVSNGRYRRELEHMVGDVGNLLHLRVEVRAADTFATLLERLSAELQGAYEHQDFNRLPTFMPECSTELDFNWATACWLWEPARSCAGLTLEPFPLDLTWERPFLPLFFETPAEAIASMTYRTDVMLPGTVERLCRQLEVCAQLFARDPQAPLAAITLG